jgi:glutamate-1-semialdehyde aminotransferase
VYYELPTPASKRERGLSAFGNVQRVGAMLTLFRPGYDELFRGLVARGVYVAPSQYEAMFVSLAHGDEEIEQTVEAARDALADDRR